MLASLFAASTAPAATDEASDLAKQAANATNPFGLDLYGRLAAAEKGNLFLSPYSIESALALTYGGARAHTAEQMARVLHFAPDLPPEKVQAAFPALMEALNRASQGPGDRQERAFDLVVANALWTQKGFDLNPGFVDLAHKRYAAGLEPVDFIGAREEARKTINAWVEKQTHDKIKDLLPAGALTERTRLVLTNAIYFKSAWDSKFSKDSTKDEPFHVDGGNSTAQVAMMHQTHRLRYADNDELQVVELPYQFRRLSMLVVLPRKLDGLAAVEEGLSGKALEAWTAGMRQREVELSLPKFKYASHFSLSQTLRSMGVEDAFGPAADLSGISTGGGGGSGGGERLYIQDVIHQAYVDVYEEGTEAAAATAVPFGLTAMPAPVEKAVFRADHPFLFLIRDNESGAILFLGRVNQPKA